MRRSMSEERLALALDQLESALARLEAAGGALAEGAAREAGARESLQASFDNLDARHRRLRASAATAIEQIDGLIAPTDADTPAAEAKDG